jgi:hypothetical protein
MTKINIPQERVFKKILIIRNHKVLLDADIAALYGVDTKRLKEAVNRINKGFQRTLCLS